MSSSNGPTASYVLTFQYNSPYPTNDMLESADILADEIVAARHSAHLYVYIHLRHKTIMSELESKLAVLATTHCLKLSNIFGYASVATSALDASEGIEGHPVFKLIVQCDEDEDPNFRRWAIAGFPASGRGYMKLKARLLARHQSQGQAPGEGRTGLDSGSIGDVSIAGKMYHMHHVCMRGVI